MFVCMYVCMYPLWLVRAHDICILDWEAAFSSLSERHRGLLGYVNSTFINYPTYIYYIYIYILFVLFCFVLFSLWITTAASDKERVAYMSKQPAWRLCKWRTTSCRSGALWSVWLGLVWLGLVWFGITVVSGVPEDSNHPCEACRVSPALQAADLGWWGRCG